MPVTTEVEPILKVDDAGQVSFMLTETKFEDILDWAR
jgi:hypothetical protein